jgi:hypothetical protein
MEGSGMKPNCQSDMICGRKTTDGLETNERMQPSTWGMQTQDKWWKVMGFAGKGLEGDSMQRDWARTN